MPLQIIRETATELVYRDTYEVEMVVPKPLVSGADLPYEDGVPLESNWQRAQMDLLIDLISLHWAGRTDFYAGGNMFIYYSQNRLKREDAHGPDFFVVKGVDKLKVRRSWVVWEEDGQYPNVIVELISPSTRREDEGRKKELYQNTFRTPEYFLCYPDEQRVVGWRLVEGRYEPMTPDERGWLWSQQLEVWLGLWTGYSDNYEYNTWLRFYEPNGTLIPDSRERMAEAEANAQAAEARAQAAEARAEAEAARRAEVEAKLRELEGKL
ncbi:MAG: Uma2 family endonuclease [Anaerolineae bacterium]